MITIAFLNKSDIGRKVIYRRGTFDEAQGELTSWNDKYVFVRFKGPTGEACSPEDVEFGVFRSPIL